jgi:dihydropyrimidinase
VEHRLFILHTLGVTAGELSLSRMVDAFSSMPARLFGLYPQKGIIAPGSDADVVIFDPTVDWAISAAKQLQNVDYTPYEGMPVKGAVKTVLCRGQVVVSDGNWVGKDGAGKYLKRERFVG